MRSLSTRLLIAASLGVLFASAPGEAVGQDTQWNRYTLEDLGGVFIRFEINDVCAGAGLSPADFEADTSLKLIEADVGVLTQAEMLENPAMPELRISVDCAEAAGGTVAWALGLRVQQVAQMLRDTQITLPEAVTWYSTAVGASASGSLAAAVGDSLTSGLDAFVEAWAAVHADEEGDEGSN